MSASFPALSCRYLTVSRLTFCVWLGQSPQVGLLILKFFAIPFSTSFHVFINFIFFYFPFSCRTFFVYPLCSLFLFSWFQISLLPSSISRYDFASFSGRCTASTHCILPLSFLMHDDTCTVLINDMNLPTRLNEWKNLVLASKCKVSGCICL